MTDKHRTTTANNGPPPRGWQERPLVSVAEIRFSGVDKKWQAGERQVRLCNYTYVYNNGYVNADMEFMRATATPAEVERFGLAVGDVIITKDGSISQIQVISGHPLLAPAATSVFPL